MEISLIRHGKSLLTDNRKITCIEFKKWTAKYDENGVFSEQFYPLAALEKVKTAKIVVTSDLKRSVESAKLLNSGAGIVSDCLFRETELPHPSVNLFNIKFKPEIWAVILRLLWFCGYSNECESLVRARDRAITAAKQLMEYANEHKSVVLVGHGFFNRLIAKELQKHGWKGRRRAGSKHWSCTAYVNQHQR